MTNPLADPEFYRDRYPTYAALRAISPVLRVPTGDGSFAYLITGYEAVRAAFTDPRLSKDTTAFFADKYSSRDLHPAVTRHMLASDPPVHTRLRKLVTKAFTPGAVERMRPYIEHLAHELVSGWAPGQPVDVVADFAVPLPVTVICEMLGVPEADRRLVRSWSNDLFLTGQHERIDAASHALGDYMTGLVQTKRRTPDDSLLTTLIATRDGTDKLSEEELVSLAVLLLVAGHETTTTFIGNALLALLMHPDALERLRRDPGLVADAIDELLRFDSPLSVATFRWSTGPFTLGGVEIPAGVPVFISPGAANRDPARFSDPDRLILHRDATGHLAFGHGIHRCLGAPLARVEGEIALRILITRFTQLRLAVPVEQLEWRNARLVRGLGTLPVLL